jgi:hypothetical protein
LSIETVLKGVVREETYTRSVRLEGGDHGGRREGCVIGGEGYKDLGDGVAEHRECIMSVYVWPGE